MRNKKLIPVCLLLLCVAGCRSAPKYKFEIKKDADGTSVAQLPKGDWYDTGVVLPPNKQLDAATISGSAGENFLVRVGATPEVSAGVTKDACCGITISIPDTMKDAHVFLKLPDSAKADVVQVRLSIGDPQGP